jgi:hypothetical protein
MTFARLLGGPLFRTTARIMKQSLACLILPWKRVDWAFRRKGGWHARDLRNAPTIATPIGDRKPGHAIVRHDTVVPMPRFNLHHRTGGTKRVNPHFD